MPLKKGSVDPDGTIWCWGSGIRCISSFTDQTLKEDIFIMPYSRDSARYDEELFELTTKLNNLMKEAHANRKNRAMTLGILVLDQGILPVWKREIDGDDDLSNYVDAEHLVHLDGKTDAEVAEALGFQSY